MGKKKHANELKAAPGDIVHLKGPISIIVLTRPNVDVQVGLVLRWTVQVLGQRRLYLEYVRLHLDEVNMSQVFGQNKTSETTTTRLQFLRVDLTIMLIKDKKAKKDTMKYN